MADPVATTALYGGAMTAALPTRLADVAAARPVPDHQEVFADPAADESLVFEIVERADIPDTDAAAFYFRDLADHNDAADTAVLQSTSQLPPSAVPGLPADGVAVAAVGRAAVAKGRTGPRNDVAIHLAVLRLPAVASDLLISVTTATRVDAGSSAAERAGAGAKGEAVVARAAAVVGGVLASWRVVDWGLFGG